MTALSCRICGPLSKPAARSRHVAWMQQPLLRLLHTGQSGRAGMPALLPMPCGPVADRKRMQQRFADHAAEQSSFGLPNPLSLISPPTFAPSPPLFDEMRSALSRSAGLRELSVHAPLDGAGAAALAEGLVAHAERHGALLTNLDLRFTSIGSARNGLHVLGGALCKLRIETLDLSFCDLRRWPAAMATYLRNDRSLKSLELRFNRMRGKGTRELLAALEQHQSLTHLNLRKCWLQPRQPGLPTNDLSWCTALGATSAPLTALELRNNLLEGRGLRALLGALAGRTFGEEAIVAALGHDDAPSGDGGGGDGDGDGGQAGGAEPAATANDPRSDPEPEALGEGEDMGESAAEDEDERDGSHGDAAGGDAEISGQVAACSLTAAAALTLLAAPRDSTRPLLEWLSLRGCSLRSGAARAVAAWLTTDSAGRLHTLHIDQNEIGGRGARALALALEQRGSGLPPGWFATVDEASGRPFFFRRDIARNRGVGAAQWERPVADGTGSGSSPCAARTPLRELGVSFCELHDASVAAILEALGRAATPPPASLRIGGNYVKKQAIAALAGLLERGGVVSLDLKKARLDEEGGRWLAPLADALQGHTPRRPRQRWPLNGLMFGGKTGLGGGGRALVEPLLPASAAHDPIV